jgi:hypothetical protein
MAETDPLAALTRPNGRPYRPRRVAAHALADEDDILCGVLVTGTHDRERALKLARELVAAELGRDYEPVESGSGWWRDGFEGGHRCWVADDERGAAGVIFGKIVEVAFSG